MNVVATIAAVVDHTSYIAKSRVSLEALKSANLLKSLNINALILGENGTGKETLAKYILPDSKSVDSDDTEEVLSYIASNDSIVIKNFDKIINYQKLLPVIQKNNTRVIATAKNELADRATSDFFSLMITLPPLYQRQEDIEPLVKKFFKEASSIFGSSQENVFSLKDFEIDLSNNCYSLKKSVYRKYLTESFDENSVMKVVENFLSKRLGGKNDYRDQLYLFDVPMLRSGFKKFGSQLAMSEKFGLNRNTLRKKINYYKNSYKLQ